MVTDAFLEPTDAASVPGLGRRPNVEARSSRAGPIGKRSRVPYLRPDRLSTGRATAQAVGARRCAVTEELAEDARRPGRGVLPHPARPRRLPTVLPACLWRQADHLFVPGAAARVRLSQRDAFVGMGADPHLEELADAAARGDVAHARAVLSDMRRAGLTPSVAHYRECLRACVDLPNPEAARQLVAEMQADGHVPRVGDYDDVFTAYALKGRGADAEAYLNDLFVVQGVKLRRVYVTRVMAGYVLERRPDDVERWYRQLESTFDGVGDDHRVLLLQAYAHGNVPERAWSWWRAQGRRPEDVRRRVFLALIEALGDPATRSELHALYGAAPPKLRSSRPVAAAFSGSFAEVDDPEASEACLRDALRGLRNLERREELCFLCASAYRRAGRDDDAERVRGFV